MSRYGRLGATVLVVIIVATGIVRADPMRLVGDGEAARWRAVGSLNVGGQRACTAALISDHEAITAAHCVVDRATGNRTAPGAYQLVLGQMADGHAAVRGVRETAFLPEYLSGQHTTGVASLVSDIALLDLDMPVTADEAVPLRVVDWANPIGAFVNIVGYQRGGPDGATIREGCTAIESDGGVTAVTCDVISGLSGAPVVLRENPNLPPVLVATVSSRSVGVGGALAIVVSIAPHLAKLRSLISP
ncbi:MAG: trypsin-like serine protease [Paracoccaceae bacterium]